MDWSVLLWEGRTFAPDVASSMREKIQKAQDDAERQRREAVAALFPDDELDDRPTTPEPTADTLVGYLSD